MKLFMLIVMLVASSSCVGDAPYRTSFDESGGHIEIVVLGDGFVRSEGERQPLEAIVLTLRQRTRAMSKEERLRFVVQLLHEPGIVDASARRRAATDLDRLLGELQVMGVRQVRYL